MAPGDDRTLPGSSRNGSHDGTPPSPAGKARSFPFLALSGALARFSRPRRSISLSACLSAYLDDLRLRARPRTLAAARLSAARFLEVHGDGDASEFEPAAVIVWRTERAAKGAANKTINTELGYIRGALSLAMHLGQIESNPLAHVRSLPTGARYVRRQPRALSFHELVLLLDAAEELDAELRGFPREPLIRVLAQTGMRWGEAISLTWSDFDAEDLTLTVRAEESKTGIGRALPIDDDLGRRISALRQVFAKIRGTFPEPGTAIFRTPRGSTWGPNASNFRRHFSEVLARAGIARKDPTGRVVCVHALRHTFATRLARAGVALAQAQALTGHRTPQVLLQIYTHLQAEDARSAIEALRLPPREGRSSLEQLGGAARTPGPDFSTRRGAGSPGRARTYNPAVNSRRAEDERRTPDEPPPSAACEA